MERIGWHLGSAEPLSVHDGEASASEGSRITLDRFEFTVSRDRSERIRRTLAEHDAILREKLFARLRGACDRESGNSGIETVRLYDRRGIPGQTGFRRLLPAGGMILLVIMVALFLPQVQAGEPFPKQRGYYITLVRTPTLGLEEWKRIIDYIQSDGANTVILSMGGAFRSKKFPTTWCYNADHKNVEKDFVRELIHYPDQKNIRVTLGFTPFGCDGVNQYTLEHPELKGIQENGNFIKIWGMHAWAYPLNPYRPEAQQFMLEYVREMFFDFYPNADGLFIESADYMISQCKGCTGPYYSTEFRFVRRISDEIWRAKPDATEVEQHFREEG